MDEPIPKRDYSLSNKTKVPGRWKEDDQEFNPLYFLIMTGMLLTIILLLLIAIQYVIFDPLIGFGLLMLGLGVTAMVLIGRSYRGRVRQPSFVTVERRAIKGKNALQSTVEMLDLAFKGHPSSQKQALQELRDLLIDRLVLRKHMSRSEVMEMTTDPIWLEQEIDRAELRSLLTAKLKESYAPELSGSTIQKEMISAFPNNYRRILELLEEM